MDRQEQVRLLQHPIRAELYTELRTTAELGLEPIPADDLGDRLSDAGHDVAPEILEYHLRVLERAGLVASDVRGYRSLS